MHSFHDSARYINIVSAEIHSMSPINSGIVVNCDSLPRQRGTESGVTCDCRSQKAVILRDLACSVSAFLARRTLMNLTCVLA